MANCAQIHEILGHHKHPLSQNVNDAQNFPLDKYLKNKQAIVKQSHLYLYFITISHN